MFFLLRGSVGFFEPLAQEGAPVTRLALGVPGHERPVLVDLDAALTPDVEVQERWEDAEAWLVVDADRMAEHPADGETEAFTTFHAVTLRVMTDAERLALKEMRRELKVQRKAAAAAAR